MFLLYLFSAIVGIPFVGLFIFGIGDADADVDMDLDVDVDVDFDTGAELGDLDVDAGGGGAWDAFLAFVSFRSLMFFLAFFGITGLVLGWLDVGAVPTFVASLGVGLFGGWLHAKVYNWLKRSSVSSDLKNHHLAGSPGRIVVPVEAGSRGRVSIDRAGQTISLTASAFKPGTEFAVGDSVVVVEVSNGTALVAPLDVLEP